MKHSQRLFYLQYMEKRADYEDITDEVGQSVRLADRREYRRPRGPPPQRHERRQMVMTLLAILD